jgi:hypothetical protein
MTRKWYCTTVLVLALLAGTFYLGCTGTDVLDVPIGNMVLSLESQSSGTERYESATMLITQFRYRPVDPDADVNLGPRDLGVLSGGINLDLLSSVPVTSTVSAAAGTYRVTSIEFGEVYLTDNDPIVAPAECMDNFENVATDVFRAEVSTLTHTVRFDPATAPTFTLSGDESTVRLIFDAEAIIRAYEDSFWCSETSSCLGVPAPCLAGFSQQPFTHGIYGQFEGFEPLLAQAITITQ